MEIGLYYIQRWAYVTKGYFSNSWLVSLFTPLSVYFLSFLLPEIHNPSPFSSLFLTISNGASPHMHPSSFIHHQQLQNHHNMETRWFIRVCEFSVLLFCVLNQIMSCLCHKRGHLRRLLLKHKETGKVHLVMRQSKTLKKFWRYNF